MGAEEKRKLCLAIGITEEQFNAVARSCADGIAREFMTDYEIKTCEACGFRPSDWMRARRRRMEAETRGE